ncbi:MAG TPA: DUF4136 domain-containing protein [Bryobacteraceae bacterium]|jgi:hypothetical protein
MRSRTRPFPFEILSVLLCASLAVPCFARKVQAVTAPDADFSKYKTYQWLPPKVLANTGIVEDDPVIAPAIKAAVDRELTARGLTQVAEGGDLLVSAVALRSASPQLEAMIIPIGAGMSMDYTSPIATVGRYNREGTLGVNLIDTRTKKFAWAGLVTDTISNKQGAGVKKIPGAAAAMFNKYPVKKGAAVPR